MIPSPLNLAELGVTNSNADSLRNELRAKSCESMYFFGKAILSFHDFIAPLHLDICTFVQDDTHKRKVMIVPRGHFKTTIMSIVYPVWRLLPKAEGWEDETTDGPNSRILLAGSTATNSEHCLRLIKAQFEGNQLFQWLFPELIPDWTKVKKWTETEVQIPRTRNNKEASVETIGQGGRVTGRHFTDIIKDDLVELNVADNPEELDKINKWHEYCEYLLEDTRRDRDYVCGTRYHKNDLYGYIKDTDLHPKGRYVYYERTGIENGQVIFPQRTSLEEYAKMRERKPYIFATQVMNNPIDPSITEFKVDWLRYYHLDENGNIHIPSEGLTVSPGRLNSYILIDPAISESKDACRTAIVNVGVLDKKHIFLLNAIARRIDPYVTIQLTFKLARMLRPHKVGVESVAYQKALKFFIDKFSIEEGLFLNVVEMKTGATSKDARIRGLIPYFGAGCVYVREDQHEFLDEYESYPQSKFRDILDALAHGPSIWTYPEDYGVEMTEEEEGEVAASGRSSLTGY